LANHPRGGKVVVAEDGVKALELIDNGSVRPHLAIVDLHMPRKDGFALVKDFAANERRHFPSVISPLPRPELTRTTLRTAAHSSLSPSLTRRRVSGSFGLCGR
jgi:CheY-like chemotaxis protein